MQTQFDLELIPQEFIDSKTALQILRCFGTLQKSESLAVLRIIGPKKGLKFFEEILGSILEVPADHRQVKDSEYWEQDLLQI